MANRLQLKRGTSTPGSIFYEGEPIYDKSGKVLYVGDDGGSGSGAGSAVASADAYSAVTQLLTAASSSAGGSVKFYEDTDNGNEYVQLSAPALVGTAVTFVLPDSDGSSGNVLVTDGSGNLSFAAPSSSSFTLSADSGTDDTFSTGGTLTFTGGTGISATVSNDQISYDLDTELQAISTVTSAANKVPYFTGSGTADVADLSAFGRTLIDDADAAAARTTLGVDAAGTDNSTDVTLVTTSYDYLSLSGQAITLGAIDLAADVTGDLPVTEGGTGASDASSARSNLGLAIGSDVQAHGDILDDLSGLTQAANKLPYFDSATTAATTDLSSFGRSLIDDADAAAARTTLGVDAAGTDNSTDVTLAGTYDYLTLSGQAITLGQIDLTTDVTGALPNGNLANSTVSYGGVQLSLGGSDATPAFDLTDATNYPASSLTGTVANNQLANSTITISDGSNSTATALGGTITIQGTSNEVTVSESSGTVTVGLPDDVTVAGDLTVSGNLNVVGTAVTFSVETTRVEDRVLELGLVDGAAPTATTTWDSAIAFNYYQTSAKKSGVVWLDNQFMAMLSELSESADTGNADPQIGATAYAPVAAGGLYIGGIASGNEVINSSQQAVNLVFDGGTY